ncbi:MAG: heme peroxidase family protein [Rubrimonas sp.]|uniref:peroxidase family protein n=1 Tax=Rubrimonas sp. TaxID=2036015 RepID=UPI002FDD56D1
MTARHACHHGMTKAKGCEHVAVGHFSKLFPDLPGLALSEEEAAILGGPGGLMHDFDDASPDSAIPAGYIFFAQFVDHDVTLDTTSDLRGAPLDAASIAKLPNIRSASLDLDCVYGFGPEASPHIYDGEHIAVSPDGRDLARAPGGAALIGDPRNDENLFISQMQLMFHRAHNRFFDERVHQRAPKERFSRFAAAQRELRFHYQWIVLFDFLKRLCDVDIWRFAATRICDPKAKFPLCYGPDKHGALPMPVEFSVAAYRVGHTMVRSVFSVNDAHREVELFDERFGSTGFAALPEGLEVDWKHMLPLDQHHRPRMAKAIDPLLTDELQDLPVVPSRNPANRALAFRNLMRANALSVPSGQAVAAALKAKGYPLEVCDLKLDDVPGWKRLDAAHRTGKSLREETPLFYYMLRESELKSCGQRLGPVGSAMLMEVFGGMLKLCGTSFVTAEPGWQPDPCVSKEKYGWWAETYREGFDKSALIGNPDYYPLELADLARFAAGG